MRHRTVATRILLSYTLVALAFTVVAVSSVVAQRRAARDAELMRSGFLPLALAVRDTKAQQDTWNSQLNHITAAMNPADKRIWFETTSRVGRAKQFAEVRASLGAAFESGDTAVKLLGRQLAEQASDIENFLAEDEPLLAELFDALKRQEQVKAQGIRDRLVVRGYQGQKRMGELEGAIQDVVRRLLDEARARERFAIKLLVGWAAFSLLMGLAVALYARRLLAPLGHVTARARAVASGDLTPRPAVTSSDELGELSTTFEGMVGAIAKANQELLTSERLATIGKMAAHVSHEIRNPLSSLALNIDLLEEDIDPRETEQVAQVKAIKAEIDHLTAISERYLSVARRTQPRLAEEDVGDLIREALGFMQGDLARDGVKWELAIEPHLPSVRVDEGQIKQVILNLIRNARDAMPGGGTVTIRVRSAEQGGVEVVVDDEGAGIDESTRQQLFQPFFTTKSHGTGLGLVITREIVEAHGGSIRSEPLAPKGTRFIVRLPSSS